MYLTYDERYWVVDVEGNSLEPDRIWVTVVRNVQTDEVIRLYNREDWAEFHKDYYIYVTHNGLCYDVPKALNPLWMAGINYNNVIDTMVLSQLYYPRIEDGHSLAAWGERFGLEKISFHDFSKLTDEMVTYCERDTEITAKVFRALINRLKQRGYSERSCEIEHKFRHIIAEQERNGWLFDKKAAIKLYRDLRQQEYDLGLEIKKKFPPWPKKVNEYKYRLKQDGTPYAYYQQHVDKYQIKWTSETTYETWEEVEFNIGSPAQRVDRLLDLGWKPTKFTKKTPKGGGGNPQVDEESLLEFAEESGIPEVSMIADWLVLNGRANMINTWLENLGDDSCIHGSVFTCGANSRRCTHSSPNTANIPSVKAKFGEECRSLWIARPDRFIVGIDAKSLEALLFAHFLGGQQQHIDYMMGDTHIMNKNAIEEQLGLESTKAQCKTAFYAYIFGAYPAKIGQTFGLDSNMGEKIIGVLEAAVPGLNKAMADAKQEWRQNNTFLKCLDGGYVRCPSERSALNYKVQPAGAVFMKQACINHYSLIQQHGFDVMKVGDIHDEWQYDSAEWCAEDVGKTAVQAMEEAAPQLNLLVPMTGDYSIGKSWAETH